MNRDRTMQHAPAAQELKVASRDLVRAHGCQDSAARALGTRQQRLSDCGRPNTPDFLRIDEVAALEDVTHGSVGHPHVTAALARRQGYVLLREPQALPDNGDLITMVAEMAKENGDVANAVLHAIVDRRIDNGECDHIIEQLNEEIAVAVRLRAAIMQIRSVGGMQL